MHNLLHLPNYIVYWGPLWGWSCFGFEGLNSKIIKRVHGTKDGCHQVNIIIITFIILLLLLLLLIFNFFANQNISLGKCMSPPS